MLTDPREQHIAAAFKAARPLPRAGWEARALAAVADIRPRRHPNLLTIIIVAALLLLLAAGVFAAVRYFFVEGTLEFHDVSFSPRSARNDTWELGSRFLSGELRWETEMRPSIAGDISPLRNQVVFSDEGFQGIWPPTRGDILVSNPNWSEQVNLTEAVGLGGVNCSPKWSPDGTMIAFQHCDPAEGLLPCETGFHLWVMNADGTDAHRVTPEGSLPTWSATWSPDGSRLLSYMEEQYPGGHVVGAITTDIWGTDIQVLPDVGYEAAWSPDGSMLVSIETLPAELHGEFGAWQQLVLTDADGGHPRVLLQQFVSDADALSHRARYPDHPDHASQSDVMWMIDVQHWTGPCYPVWSPSSDKIAFLAALPFDPDGLFFKDQIEVWVYDLTTDELIRVTDDDVGQTSLSWK